MMPEANNITRRKFLRRAAAAGAAFALPTIVPSSVLAAEAPSNRITVGFIGTGGQGMHNMRGFLANSDAQVVAVCDVETYSNDYGSYYKGRDLGREPARRIVEEHYAGQKRSGLFKSCDAYVDFRDLLAREDIDVVVISTPDHWHIPMAIAAVKAGKDIYCEKPLTLTIAEGRTLSDAVEHYGRVLQTGTQHRSNAKHRFACELVRNGRIGKVHTIRVRIPGNNCTCGPTWHPMPVPKGFDYDMWLGPAPWAPYTKQRCHYEFRFVLDHSGGQITNFGAHYIDLAQWGNGTEHTGPVEIVGRGEFPETGLFDTATKVDVQYTYADGVKLFCSTGTGPNVLFQGSDGWISIKGGVIDAHPKSLLESKISPNEIHLYSSIDHKRNFLDCVKTRAESIAPVRIGHRSITICHLGNIAMMLKRKLQWDTDTERFVNDAEADRMLARPMRNPWHS